ncbi:hypothetical protein L915_11867 [Phytophthora nicotianae]|uniref:Uncharacterized protein n=1 Tax=Phytophthora nicotianae TaxID=4792 RepID=W2IPP6_PHYNI|nr:hypothetical protein L915_11867 [Phytophthora nicotianae]ETL36199.1 hypothetical protein L916_11795 [Phytophthora nicotianae]
MVCVKQLLKQPQNQILMVCPSFGYAIASTLH